MTNMMNMIPKKPPKIMAIIGMCLGGGGVLFPIIGSLIYLAGSHVLFYTRVASTGVVAASSLVSGIGTLAGAAGIVVSVIAMKEFKRFGQPNMLGIIALSVSGFGTLLSFSVCSACSLFCLVSDRVGLF